MKTSFATFVLLCVSTYGGVYCQIGSGQELHSTSFSGELTILSKNYTDDLTNKTSDSYMSLKYSFESGMRKELKNHFTLESVIYGEIEASVVNFTSGSVVVAFHVRVDGTTMTLNDLGTAIRNITADNQLGSYTINPVQDIDECTTNVANCSEFANCTNLFGGYDCTCGIDYYDHAGDGTVCEIPATVTCDSDRMQISVMEEYLEELSISRSQLRLRNEDCDATFNSSSRIYDVIDDLTSCGCTKQSNASHVTYSNVLSNTPTSKEIIVTGTNIFIPFSCSYPRNLSASTGFESGVPKIEISILPGEGSFEVSFNLFEDSLFEKKETNRKFKTTDMLFLQAQLRTSDVSLVVVLEECWASPSKSIDDDIRYKIITDGCVDPDLASGAVGVITNGEDRFARFKVKVFTFIKESTTYIHCNLAACSTVKDSCQPVCSSPSRARRDIRSSSRQSSGDMQEKSVGPLYRIASNTNGSSDVRLWAVTATLLGIILILLGLATVYVLTRKRRKAKRPVTALSLRSLEDTSAGLHAVNEMACNENDDIL